MNTPTIKMNPKQEEITIDFGFLHCRLKPKEKAWSATFMDEKHNLRQTFSLAPDFWEKPRLIKEVIKTLYPEYHKQKKDELVTLFSKTFTEMAHGYANFDEFKGACERANPKEEEKDEKIQIVEACTGKTKDMFFEVFRDDEDTCNFVCYNTKTDEIDFKEQVVNGNKIYVPPMRIPFEPILPSTVKPKEKPDMKKLYTDIKQYVFDNCDFPNAWDYDVMAHWIFGSWFYEGFDSFPYLFFHGPQGCGKTRAMEILVELAYHSYKSSSASESALCHDAEEKHITMLLDEAEFIFKNKQEIIPILNAGYKKGDYYTRRDDMNKSTIYMVVYGPKAIASRSKLPSPVMEKSLIFKMSKNKRKVSSVLPKKEAGELRKRLLEARLTLRDAMMPIINNRGGALDGTCVAQIDDGRLKELVSPLYLMALMAHTAEYLEEWVAMSQKAKKMEMASWHEALILSVIVDILEGKDDFSFPIMIMSAEVTDRLNVGLSGKDKYSVKYIGKTISSLGFDTKRVRNKRGYWIEAERFISECTNYSVEISDTWKDMVLVEKKIKILKPIIQHLSKAGKKFIGPFEVGDEITLVVGDADRLIKQQMAEAI